MLQRFKNKLKEQKGFTLIELLAVIVILGIIAAIAVPSVLGLIDNTKKDAHVANANQMIASAKMAVANNAGLQTLAKVYIPLEYLETGNYLETIKDPDTAGVYKKGTITTLTGVIANTADPTTDISYVKVENGLVTGVRLSGSTRGVKAAAGTTGGIVAITASTELTRDNVK